MPVSYSYQPAQSSFLGRSDSRQADTVHPVRPTSCSRHDKEIQNADYGVVQLCAACRVGQSCGREMCTVSTQHASAKGCQARPDVWHSHTSERLQVRALCAVVSGQVQLNVGLVLIARSLFVGVVSTCA